MSAANEGSDRPSHDGRTLTTTGTPYRHRHKRALRPGGRVSVSVGDDGTADAGQQKKGARTSYRDIRAPEGRRLPTLPTGGSVPSAMAGLTALFGMDRGGSPPQWPPSITLGENQQVSAADHLTTYQRTHYSQPLTQQLCCSLHTVPTRQAPLLYHVSFREGKSFGGLVRVGFGITAFTPPAYRRRSLQRPSWEVSSRRRLRA